MGSSAAPKFPRSLQLLAIGCILAIVGLAFQGARSGAFLSWDDDINIVRNQHLDGLTWPSVRWMFTDVSHMRRYVPLAWLGFGIDRELFGLTPRAVHVGNIIFHAANTVLVFFVLRRLIALRNVAASVATGPGLVAALFGALIWGLHPLRVEVVAWASGRMYCQAGFFFFSAVLCYLHGATLAPRSRARTIWNWISAGLFGASLLTYPIGLMLPFVLVVIDWCVLRRFVKGKSWVDRAHRDIWLEKLPFVAIALAVGGATIAARFAAQGIWAPPPTLAQFGAGARVAQAGYVWMYYVWKPLFPVGLAPVYTTLVGFDPASSRFIASAIALVVMTALLIWRRKEWPVALGLWIAHLLLLTPMLGLTEQPHYTNDRYSYLVGAVWSAGLVALVLKVRPWLARPRMILHAAAILLIIALAGMAAAQVKIWRSNETLFRTLYALTEGTRYRADIALRLGDEMRRQNRVAEAADCYRESLRIIPNNPRAAVPHFGLGAIAHLQQRWQEAVAHYEAALRLSPDFPEALRAYAELLVQVGRSAEAAALLPRVVASQPADAGLRDMFGVALFQSGRSAEAVEQFEAAVRLRPDAVSTWCNLAAAQCVAGRPADALISARNAVRLNPQLADAHLKLGDALRMLGQIPEATTAVKEAVRLRPESAALNNNLGMTFAAAGRFEEAAGAFREAIRLDPQLADHHYNLGRALRDLHRNDEAIVALTNALRLKPDHTGAREVLEQLKNR